MSGALATKQSPANRVEVGIVDCDIHNTWSSWQELSQFLPQRWRDHVDQFGSRRFPGTVYPRFWETSPPDRLPPTGGPAGSDAAFMGQNHLDRYNIAYAILIPLCDTSLGMQNTRFATALAAAVNDWNVTYWLQADSRMRGSLVIECEDTASAVAEIRRHGSDRRFVQVYFSGRAQEPMGRLRYWPIYEACVEHGLAIMTHAYGSTGNPITGAGWPTYYIEEHTGPSQTMQANITSLIMEGVFEEFPALKVASIENAFGWAPSLMWRMDNAYRLLHREVPHLTRLPSEYMTEHVYFATQPMEEPERPEHLRHLLGQYPAFAERLIFASDYPHWDGDVPDRTLNVLRDDVLEDKILRGNAQELYGLR